MSAALIIPAGASTDPILRHDLSSAAGTVTSAGSTFDAPLLNVAEPAYSTRNTHATMSAYGGGGSGAGETAVVTGTATLGFSDVPLRQVDLASHDDW
jgi:ABC-type phosphate transport system substrate-binding protein